MPLQELNERRTTSDQIADALREAILMGEFKDNEELNQVALAKHFGVSRVPLREALRQLQAEGLVSAKAHQRAVVTPLSMDRIVELMDLRSLLEADLLERAAPSLDREDLDRLDALCEEMEDLTDDVTHPQWLAKNREFHQQLYREADAPFTQSLVEQITKRVERYLHLFNDRGVERRGEANLEHRAILEALRQHRVREARRELDAHIAHTRDRMMALLKERGMPAEGPGD